MSETPEEASMPGHLSRRAFLGASGATTASALAGCLTVAPQSPPERVDEPTSESESLPERPATLFRADIERSGYWPEESVPDAVELAWSIPGINKGDHTAAKSSPLYYDGAVITPGDTGTVHSFDPDGERLWAVSLFPSTRGTHSTPAIVGDFIFTAGYDGAAYAFDTRTGETVWRTKVSDAIGSSPVYYDGLVYVATEFYTPSGGMVALDAATGAIRWEDNRMTNHAHSITGIDTDTRAFAAGCNDGSLYVWDLDSRNFRGSFETDGAIKGPICMYDGTAIFGSWDGTVYAVDAETLAEVWRYGADGKVMAGAAVHPASETLIIGSHDHHIHAMDVTTGEGRWTFDTGGMVVGSPTVVGDTVLTGSYSDALFAVDVTSGEQRWSFTQPEGWVTGTPAVHDGAVYVTERATDATSGHLYKLVAPA
ncbi:MAG: PQQ-binding-like beta-propeller repeat protein [Haloarculaceae archaeon]